MLPPGCSLCLNPYTVLTTNGPAPPPPRPSLPFSYAFREVVEGKKNISISSHSSALVSKVNSVHSLHRMGLTVFVVAEQQTSLLFFFPFFCRPTKTGGNKCDWASCTNRKCSRKRTCNEVPLLEQSCQSDSLVPRGSHETSILVR